MQYKKQTGASLQGGTGNRICMYLLAVVLTGYAWIGYGLENKNRNKEFKMNGTKILSTQQGASGPYLVITDKELFEAMDLDQKGLEKVKKAVAIKDYEAAYQAWGEYWARRDSPVYYVDAETYAKGIKDQSPELVEILVSKADEMWSPDYTHGTYTPKREGRTFQWVDSVSDSAYCGLHYLWFIKELGRAYLLTGDTKYPEMFREIVCSWWDALPDMAVGASYWGKVDKKSGLAIIWNNGLGSSLRCVHMMDNYYLMRESPEFTTELHRKILKIFLGHARYMFDTKMKSYWASNFQASITCWTVTAGIMLPEFRESRQWCEIGIERLEERILRNFEEDGAQVEQCPQYHLAGMRDIIRPLMLLHRNRVADLSKNKKVWKKLEQIYDYPLRIAHPTGHLALFNSGVYCTEWLSFLPLGMELFNSPLQTWAAGRFIKQGFIPRAKGISNYILFMDGNWFEKLDEARRANVEPPSFTNDLLKHSGTAMLRSGWDENAFSLMFDFNREPYGGHAYPGRLSFDLFAYGTALVVNPGSTLSYSMPVYSRWCNQTIGHNTVMVNNKSQRKPYFAKLEKWYASDRVTFVSASTGCYKKSDDVVLQRSIIGVTGEYFFIFDRLSGGKDKTPLAWLLHSPQDISKRTDGSVASSDGKPGLLVVPDSLTRANSKLEMGIGYAAVPVNYTKGYKPLDAWRDDIPYMRLNSIIDTGIGGQTYGVLLKPFAVEAPEVKVVTETEKSPGRLPDYTVRIDWGDHSDLISIQGIETETVCTVTRTDKKNNVIWRECTQ